MRTKLAAVAVAVLMVAGSADAALSKAAQEWRNGPEKWLMTGEEQKAWKGLASDAEAAAFIDLFWARRDPTPGTPRNEFHEEFLGRVRFADAKYTEKRRRGALTERGQVFIILGPAIDAESNHMSTQATAGMSSASGRTGDRITWRWPREKAITFGMPKMEVAFVQQAGSDQYIRDVRFGQFVNAHPAILRSLIVSPDLPAVPTWAAQIGSKALQLEATPRVAAKASGRIGRVLLLADLGALDLDTATDPLTALQPATVFSVDGDLAYVIEYCGNSGALKVETRVRDLSAASELSPAPMKAVAGCGAVPGMLSLSGLTPGSYDLEITTIEANGGRLETKSRFQIK
jgi:GWxTD domain-containing protein